MKYLFLLLMLSGCTDIHEEIGCVKGAIEFNKRNFFSSEVLATDLIKTCKTIKNNKYKYLNEINK